MRAINPAPHREATRPLARAPTGAQLDLMVPLAAGLVFVAAWVLLVLEVDPVPTWFYVFAWYPLLIIANHVTKRIGTRGPLFTSLSQITSLFGWSAVIWLVFEAVNFRLRNWYYVFLPVPPVERWTGILLSFGTVVPALLLAERLLDGAGVARNLRTRPLRWKDRNLALAQFLGVGMAALALAFPRTFFPLVWGAALLVADPIVWRRRPDASLFADMVAGSWGRIARLMLGGLVVGLVWEFLNFWARGKWIYTVPWLEQTKLFEMPPLGFLGFPFFALEAWAMYQMVSGHSGDPSSGTAARQRVIASHRRSSLTIAGLGGRAAAVVLAAAFSVFVLLGMERWTISSVSPTLADMPGVSSATVSTLDSLGVSSPFALARADTAVLARTDALSNEASQRVVETARLVTLRGIGTVHATRLGTIGIATVCQLARHQAPAVWHAYHQTPRPRGARLPGHVRPTRAEVRVWIGAARRACTERFQVRAQH